MAGRADVEARIQADDVVFDDGDAALLRAVDDAGSLNAATVAMGRSFAHAQRRIVELEGAFGDLVRRTRGGAGGGGSELTELARDLLARYDRLAAEGSGLAEVEHTILRGHVVEREGELGTAETPAGRVRALVPPDAESVAVSVRSDAVTLHEPPGPEGTSALNRFRGSVVDVDRGDAIAVVTVELGSGDRLEALVTLESAARLDLAVGTPLVATFKATATRAVGVPSGERGAADVGEADADGTGESSRAEGDRSEE